ncbi:hypothetical protein [Naasia lichenicola]|uniref:Uncharacterized protein n=1 Tax=Naasia lichenicola TaxID=2565933 RepID=A0A4S4FK03_9MICO|nr:hypothetical protein [Naasia lichenicola]THG30659.1 hypothetical protein E6C64_08445 [Naasia lichenicola]THG31896.1 hypothetical protein E6C64_07590 [Naasia lichenicola]
MVDVPARLEFLRKLATGPGATHEHIAQMGPEMLKAFEVDSPEELRRDIRRAAYSLPSSRTTEAIIYALAVQDIPQELPLTLEGRRKEMMRIQATDFRNVIRRERRGVEELELLMENIQGLAKSGHPWPWSSGEFRRLVEIDTKRRLLFFVLKPIVAVPE